MKCPNCNHTIPDRSDFCAYCGQPISRLASPSIWSRIEGWVLGVPGLVLLLASGAALYWAVLAPQQPPATEGITPSITEPSQNERGETVSTSLQNQLEGTQKTLAIATSAEAKTTLATHETVVGSVTSEATSYELTGPSLIRITDDPADEYVASLSPDQRNLLFMSNKFGKWQIYLADADGSNWYQLTFNEADNYHPHFSPDGSRIAFASNMTGDWEIYTVTIEGTDLRQLTRSAYEDQYPCYSPDGRSIVFMSRRSGTWGVYLMTVDGTGQEVLIDDARANETYPVFCADGRFIAYQSNVSGNHDIYLMSIAERAVSRLTSDPARDAVPVCSPDGQWIAFESNRAGNYDVYVTSVSGAFMRQITSDPSNEWVPAWSPDGRWILFQSDRYGSHDIFRIELLE